MSRSELTLGQIARQWQYQPRGEAFTQALLSFFKSFSGDTLQGYAFSILEFYGWLWQRDGRLPTPDHISRGDAVEFNKWLRTRKTGLTKWWLEQDPERRLDLQLYEIIAREPKIQLDGISRQLGAYTPNARTQIGRRLACLVKRRTLDRSPTVAEYRRQHGSTIVDPPDEIFRYTVSAVETSAGAERASTVATRLSALASLWSYMIRSGENVPGSTDPLLRHNIWDDPLRQARGQASSHQEVNRQAKKPDLQLFLSLLATTFSRTHGVAASQAAEAAFLGRLGPEGRKAIAPSFKDLRDRALLLLMAQTGVRAREVGRLRRRDVVGDPPMMTIVGKRGKKRTIAVPLGALSALKDLTDKLAAMSAQQARYSGSHRADTLLGRDAPLLPAVAYWGANAGQREGGLTRPGIALVLNRRAEAAGIDPASPLFQKAHPHGLRALFITYALETGTPIHRVQAIAGHASVATTGRYAEERRPELLVADVFRGPAALSAVPVAAPLVTAATWRPLEESIAPPAPPAPEPPVMRPRAERVERVPAVVRRAEPERVEREHIPLIAPPREMSRSTVDELADRVARWRKRPIAAREEKTLEKCIGLTDEALRNLCVIYGLHWGEEGNRQVLVSSGGGEASALSRAERRQERVERFEENQEEDDDEDDDEDEEDDEFDPFAALAEVDEHGQKRIAEIARAGSVELHAEAGTDKLNRIYSGKDSGLNWWTGTQGKLKPEMPVMSPDQVGACTADEQDTICAGLVKLWQRWFEKSPTKAESLVRWLGEALDTSAQLESEIRRRSGSWVPATAAWDATPFSGSRHQPAPRSVFREHLAEEVVAWFEARAGAYQVSVGDPTTWQKKTAKPKAVGEMPPAWFSDSDPIWSLPADERRALLDWILTLSGQLPVDTEGRFVAEGGGYRASRADIAQLLWALCQFDQAIDAFRESAEFGPQYTASLFRNENVDDLPVAVRATFQEAQRHARYAMSSATGGRIADFDAWGIIRGRVKGRKQAPARGRRRWVMDLVAQHFGSDAASDPALALVARCGNVPLVAFRDLFRVSGDTIVHTPEFKRAFAEQFGSHSECVARRIVRQLWEIRQGRAAPKEAVDKPQHMVTLVEVMRTFKVPCSDTQEHELAQLVPWLDKPEGIYQEYAKARTAAGEVRAELSEAEEQERQLAEEYEEAIAGALRAEQFGTYEMNPHELALPTPVHLMLAVSN